MSILKIIEMWFGLFIKYFWGSFFADFCWREGISYFVSFTFWNLSSAEVSLHKSIFDLDEDFDSKEDF